MGKFSIIGYMGLDSSKFVSEGKKAKTAGGKLSGFLKGAFVAGIAMAAAALVAFVAKGIKSFIDMDKKAREVFTLIPGASDEMKQKLVKGARDISQSYGIDVVEALDGMYKALSAGIPKENVVDFLKVAADAAKGGVSTLGEAVGAITTVLNGYGMEASKARDVSDILFTAVKGGSTTFGELGKNVGKVTPIASALGISFDQVGAMFADLTLKLGDGKTAEAGTQINAMLAELGKSGTVADKAFKKLSGGSFPDFIAGGGDVKSAILAMRTEADANNMQMIDMFGSIEAGKAAMSMTEKGAKGLTQALKDQEERMGSTKEAADEMKKAFADKLAVAGEKVNDIFRRVGEVLMKLGGGSGGIFDMMVGYVDVLVGYLEKASNGGGALSKVFGVLGEAMKFSIKVGGTTINIFKMMIGVFELIITVLNSLGQIYKAVFQPLFTIAEAGGKIMMAFAEAIASGFSPSAWKKFGDVVDGELDRVVDSFDNWGTNIDKVMTQENKNMKKAWDGFAQSTRDSVAEIGDIWKETGNWGFLNEELMEADALNKARIEAEKIAVLEGEARAESEKRKKLAEQQAKLLGERIAKQKILNAEKERITKLLERAEATTKRIKMLEKAKVELNKKIADRKKEINAHIQKENGLQSEALGIVQNLLNQDGMRVRDKKRLWAIQAEIKKQEQKTKDASDEGFKALQETRKALLMIKDVEEQILRRKLRAKGLTEEQIDLHMKDARSITGVDKSPSTVWQWGQSDLTGNWQKRKTNKSS